MPPLSEHQWEITSPDGSVDLVFGTLATGIQTKHAPDLGQRSVRTSDKPLPREDGRAFGPDYDEGTTLLFEVNVLSDGGAAQSDLLNRLRGTWGDPIFRQTPESYAILKCCHAGRTRRCYGRPRRFAETDGDLTHEGYTEAVFDFATTDGKFYDDIETVETLGVLPATIHGLTEADLVDPLVMQQPEDSLSQITVQGQATWVTATIHGPIDNPSVDLGEVAFRLKTSIPDGVSVTVDPRPWSRGVFRSDGANLAGALTWDSTPLRRLKVNPGTYPVSFRGSSSSGTAYAEVAWRNAHDRP